MKIRCNLCYFGVEMREMILKKCAMSQQCVGAHLCHGAFFILRWGIDIGGFFDKWSAGQYLIYEQP